MMPMKPLKNLKKLGKKLLFDFWAPIFLHTKAVSDVKNSLCLEGQHINIIVKYDDIIKKTCDLA